MSILLLPCPCFPSFTRKFEETLASEQLTQKQAAF